MTKLSSEAVGIDLYWLPLGAGGNFVRLNGRLYEAIVARLQHRKPNALYHSGLEVIVPEGRYVIEQTPVVNNDGPERGVVAEGPVGARWAGRWRIFRYEVRRWRDGLIPDLNEAVDSPQRLTNRVDQARRLLDLVPQVPTLVWGRDELKAGEMWNSDSIVSWLLARTGLDVDTIKPPAGGRAPGWKAGHLLAKRQAVSGPADENRFERAAVRLEVAGRLVKAGTGASLAASIQEKGGDSNEATSLGDWPRNLRRGIRARRCCVAVLCLLQLGRGCVIR